MEHRLSKNVLSMIVCTFVNKVQNLKNLKFKNSCYEFRTWGAHSSEDKTKGERMKATFDVLKKISKLPQKQPAKEQSPDTQQTDSSLRAVKIDGYTEGCAGHAPARRGQISV